MKLRTKLTAFSIALVVISVIACCFIILSYAWQNAMDGVTKVAISDYNSFYYSFISAVRADIPDHPSVKRSFIINQFRTVPGAGEFTLRSGDEFLCNNVGFDVESMIGDGKSFEIASNSPAQYKTIQVNGTDYFIAHCATKIGEESYDISLVRDISETTGNIQNLALQCIIASLIVTVIAAAVMWLIVFQSLKPIKKLQAGANELAQGRYEKRIPVTGKDELSALAFDFNSMAGAIETNVRELHETAERQQAFINGLSHELKTPVTSIMLCSETLMGRKVSAEDMSRSLERIYDQSKWLERLSQKLMALVMLQGGIEKKPESVAKLLDAVKDTTSEALLEKSIELIIDCRIDTLAMDFDLMRSALVNLIDNARKASEDGQTVELYAHDNMIEVIDHGRGIPPEEIARITEPFYVVDRSRSKKHGGAGFGLALVKQIADAHGAEFTIDSVLNVGTTMRLTFDAPQ